MKTFTILDIRSWDPCYDPNRYLPEDWSGTAVDILRHLAIPPKDRLWVVLRPECIDDKTLRLFAVDYARRALARIPNPDPRSLTAIEVAERFANEQATKEELATAREAAYDAARAADAAYAARATYDARAAYDAAYAAYAARAAYDAAAYDAAAAAANTAAADYERQEQVQQLLQLLGETI